MRALPRGTLAATQRHPYSFSCSSCSSSTSSFGSAFSSRHASSTSSRLAELRRLLEGDAADPGSRTDADWIPGLLKPGTDDVARLSPDLAAELLFEVGWNARHRYLDVRQAADGGTVRGAIRCPYLPEPHTFEARAAAALYEPQRSALGGGGDDPRLARIIVGCDGSEDAEDAAAAAALLHGAGYVNAVVLDGGFARWRMEGFPTEGDEDEDVPDSTL